MESHLAPLPIVNPEAGLQDVAFPQGVNTADFDRRTALARAVGSHFVKQTPHRDVAASMKMREEAAALMKSDHLKVFDISPESETTREAYGKHAFCRGSCWRGSWSSPACVSSRWKTTTTGTRTNTRWQ
jgi:hypothetical protein